MCRHEEVSLIRLLCYCLYKDGCDCLALKTAMRWYPSQGWNSSTTDRYHDFVTSIPSHFQMTL